MNDLLRELNTLTPGGDGFWARVSNVFDRMEIAEDEITKAQARHPKHSERIWGAFKLLCAPQLSGYPDVIYRAHCTELLDRVANDVDTRLGTKAEVMVACSQTSLEHPIVPAATSLYAKLFLEIFPDKEDVVQDILNPSLWVDPGDVDELLGILRVKTSVDDRVLEGE